jgi:hypothetical protein
MAAQLAASQEGFSSMKLVSLIITTCSVFTITSDRNRALLGFDIMTIEPRDYYAAA